MSTPRRALLIIDMQYDFLPPSGSLAVPHALSLIPIINNLVLNNNQHHAQSISQSTTPSTDPSTDNPPPPSPLLPWKWDVIIYSKDYHLPGHVSFASSHGSVAFSSVTLPSGTCQMLWPDHCVQGSPGSAIHSDLIIYSYSPIHTSSTLSSTIHHPSSTIHHPSSTTGVNDGPPKPRCSLSNHSYPNYTNTPVYFIYKGINQSIDSYSAFCDNDGVTSTDLLTILRSHSITHTYSCGVATDYCVSWTAMDAFRSGFHSVIITDAVKGVTEVTTEKALLDARELGVQLLSVKELV